ncbi:L-fuconolactonase [Ewingella americana]
MSQPRIDAHQHFWRYEPRDYRWISDDMAVLKQDLLPEQLAPALQRHEIQASVVVQACSSIEETRWLLEIAEQTSYVKGVVGWVDIASPKLEAQLEQLAHPLLRGIRHQVQDEANPAAWLSDGAVNRGLRQLQKQGYVYELLVTHRHLLEGAQFAARHDKHALILDHFGKPDLSQGARHWAQQIAPFAALEHVSCKLSGLLTEPRPAGMTPNDLLPYFDVALDAFGPERLLFGSDWPVCLLAGSYQDALTLCQRATTALSSNQQDAIFGGNAYRLYNLQNSFLEYP